MKKVFMTGATGNIASYVIPQLIKARVTVNALVRDEVKASHLKEMGTNLFVGDLTAQGVLNKAAEGVDTILAVTPAGPDGVSQGNAILKAALNSGSPYFIRISAIGAAKDAPTDNGRLHYQSDKALIESGLTYTILRPHYYMQNLFVSAESIMDHGAMYWGMGDGKLGMIDVRDIADMVVSLVLKGGYENQILNPTGPEVITFQDTADIISKGIGKDVNYVRLEIEQVGDAIREAGWGEWAAQVMMDYSKAYANDWGNFTNDEVEQIAGHKPRTFQQFFDEVMSQAFESSSVS